MTAQDDGDGWDGRRDDIYKASTRPFTDEERPIVLQRIRDLPDVDGEGPRPWNLRRVLLTLYYFGLHPEVLVHPKMRKLAVWEDHLEWSRPKTGRFMSVPLNADVRPWMASWIASLPEYPDHTFSTRTYAIKEGGGETRTRQQDVCYLPLSRLVIRQMTEWGYPGYSARTFRHDRARRVFMVRGELADVEMYVGVSPTVAIRYAKRRDSVIETALKDEADTPPPGPTR